MIYFHKILPIFLLLVGVTLLLVLAGLLFRHPRLLFERAGLTVIPFPVEFQVSAGGGVNVMDVLPTAAAPKETELAWREMYGQLFYFVVR